MATATVVESDVNNFFKVMDKTTPIPKFVILATHFLLELDSISALKRNTIY